MKLRTYMGRVAWIIQEGPMESHEFLEEENFFCWGQKKIENGR